MNKHVTEAFRAWLALALVRNLSAFKMRQLLEVYASPEAVLRANKEEIQPDWTMVDRHIAWMEQSSIHHIVLLNDEAYPLLLRQIDDPPLALFVRGQLSCLANPQIALVGSRKPTYSGLDNAFMFAQQLAEAGLTITSGFAKGIDGASHRGAIAAKGPTIGVLGSGIDEIYPSQHKKLAEEIMNNGALVSELPLGSKPLPIQFPRRNRIVSGMSMGTVVIEANLRSGSLITARLAAEQGREVFAIPGSIHSPTSQGCHQLLRNGAKLVTTTTDILEELVNFLPSFTSNSPKTTYNKPKTPLEQADHKLLECLGFEATTLDTLLLRSGMAIDEVTRRLLNMELDGYIYTTPTGYLRVTL